MVYFPRLIYLSVWNLLEVLVEHIYIFLISSGTYFLLIGKRLWTLCCGQGSKSWAWYVFERISCTKELHAENGIVICYWGKKKLYSVTAWKKHVWKKSNCLFPPSWIAARKGLTVWSVLFTILRHILKTAGTMCEVWSQEACRKEVFHSSISKELVLLFLLGCHAPYMYCSVPLIRSFLFFYSVLKSI